MAAPMDELWVVLLAA
jgi:hypothetical protein